MSESVILWIIGTQTTILTVLIGLVARYLAAHTDACRKFQEKFLVEHGEIRAKLEIALAYINVHNNHG